MSDQSTQLHRRLSSRGLHLLLPLLDMVKPHSKASQYGLEPCLHPIGSAGNAGPILKRTLRCRLNPSHASRFVSTSGERAGAVPA